MKSLLLIISLLFLTTIISCNSDDCGGGDPAIYDFAVYYIDRSTGENLLGIEEQTISNQDLMVSVLEDGRKHSIGQNFSLDNRMEKGYYLGVGYYETVLPRQLS